MDAKSGQKTFRAVERKIKEHIKLIESWKCKYQDGIETAVACRQIFSDK